MPTNVERSPAHVPIRLAQTASIAGMTVLAVAAPVGRGAVAAGGAITAVCGILAIVGVMRAHHALPPLLQRIFHWMLGAGVFAFVGKVWWTADLLADGAAEPFPSPSDYLMAGAVLLIGVGFLRALRRHRRPVRLETLIDIALVAVAAMILFLPMRLGDVMALEGSSAEARAVAAVSLAVAAGNLLLLALLIAWRGEELHRRSLLGLAVGSIAMSVFVAWAAMLAISGAPIPHVGMDVVALAAILGLVSAADVPAGATTLEARVAERTAHLSGALHQLEQEITRERQLRTEIVERERLASIGSIVAGAAHQINNPLSAVSAFAQLMLKDPALNAEQRESLEIINSETLRAADVIRDLRAFARRSLGEQRPVDLNELIELTLRLRMYQLSSANIRVETRLDESLPSVTGDTQQLQQVVNNLLENAIAAVSGHENASIGITTRRDGDRVVLEVRDSGPGVPENVRDRIFEPFFTTRAEGQGMGLGLSVVYGIVAGHDGSIRLSDSRPGSTTFIVEFPAAAGAGSRDGVAAAGAGAS